MAEFVEQASVEALDGRCLNELQRPSFFLDLSGPTLAPQTDNESSESGND